MRKNYLILKAIAEKRITQAEVTRQAEISSEARLSRIIHYITIPTEEEVLRICKILNLEADDIKGRNL